MKPEQSAEQHLQTIAEMSLMRMLLMVLADQSPNPKELLSNFEQRVEEGRHTIELTGAKDERFESFAEMYSRWIAVAQGIPRP